MPAPTRPVFPVERLQMMIAEFKQTPVEELDRRDWLGLLHAVNVLLKELEPPSVAGHQPTRDALIAALHRAQRSGLPVGPNRVSRESRSGTVVDDLGGDLTGTE